MKDIKIGKLNQQNTLLIEQMQINNSAPNDYIADSNDKQDFTDLSR